jgi:cytochrome bd-type quinol oxidase subunit 2
VAVEFSATARRLGIFSAVGIVVLDLAYAVTLTVGFLSLKSPQQPIGDPMFSILEVLIIVMMPVMVALMVAVHAWAPSHAKTLSLTAVVFMCLLAGVTCSLHFVILTLSRQGALALRHRQRGGPVRGRQPRGGDAVGAGERLKPRDHSR